MGDYGNKCNHVEADEKPYCYVSKSACDFQNIESTLSQNFNDNDTSYSYEVCEPGNHNIHAFLFVFTLERF